MSRISCGEAGQSGGLSGAGRTGPRDKQPGFHTLHAIHVEDVAYKLKRGGGLFALALTSLVALVLLDARYPTWRVGALGALLLAPLATTHAMLWLRRGVWKKPCVALPAMAMLPLTGALALTGGMTSPLTPLLFSAPIAIFYYGRSRQSLWLVASLCGSALVLAAMPESWSGPLLPHAHRVAIATTCLLFTAVRLYVSITVLTDAYRHAGETLQRTREDVLEQATSRGRELDCIGSKVAHELKNPLAAIKALAQLLARNAKEEESRTRLAVITGEVTRMESILRDYLSFSRPLGDLRLGAVDLIALCNDTVAVVEARALTAGVTIERQGDGPAHVVADQQRLKEALLNLLSNALEATPTGGRVDVVIEPRAGKIDLLVRDTGRGIAPEHLARVGAPFFTTREGGTGLGVVLARSIVVQHEGTLSYESSPGRGTTARITLPRLM
jgi:two-component sensor histidine kinase